MVTLEVNKAYEKIFKIKRKSIINKKFSQYSKEHDTSWLQIYGNVALTGVPETREIFSPKQKKWYQTYAYSPQKTYLILLFLEITEQKKTQQQLLLSEKKYRQLYETTRDGIMARDMQGKMIDCNKAYAKMLGYTKKELKQLSVRELMPEKWFVQREVVVQKVLRTGKSIVFEREYQRKNGAVFPASVRTWRLTDDRGNVLGIWSLVRDISMQKQLQNKLQKHADLLEKVVQDRTNQLKDSERLAAIGQTAGMVGHDLRNPLQTIIGEIYLAKEDIKSLVDCSSKSSLQESIRTIEEQTLYMDKIVSDLQNFVRPIKIDKDEFDLKKLVKTVLQTIPLPDCIQVNLYFAPHFPIVKADLQLLKRVLINLITNAVQAMPKGGKIAIKAKTVPPNQVIITVKDQGAGIPEAIKPQIFKPLFTTKSRGQGFGLAVCKRMIEAHGGNISFESQEGKGAEFTIQLPMD